MVLSVLENFYKEKDKNARLLKLAHNRTVYAFFLSGEKCLYRRNDITISYLSARSQNLVFFSQF